MENTSAEDCGFTEVGGDTMIQSLLESEEDDIEDDD